MAANAPGYWQRVRALARALRSDGCTGVVDLYPDCCYEHDVHYRTHRDLGGAPITRAEADARFRRCIQARSPLGRLSPVAFWWWLAVRLLAGPAWRKHGP